MGKSAQKFVNMVVTVALAAVGAGLGEQGGLSTRIMGQVMGGIAGNLASDYLSFFNYDRLKSWIRQPHPDKVNHDIERGLQRAVLQAFDNVQLLYLEKYPDPTRKKEVRATFKRIKADLDAGFAQSLPTAVTSAELQTYLYDDPDQALQLLTDRLAGDFTPDAELTAFIRANIIPQIQLCFGEILKNPDDPRPRIAFQRFLQEETRSDLKQLLATQEQMAKTIAEQEENRAAVIFPKLSERELARLRELAGELQHPLKFEARFEIALNQVVGELRSSIARIAATTLDTNERVQQIETGVLTSSAKLHRIEKAVQGGWNTRLAWRLFAIIGLLTLGLSLVVMYYQRQPFMISISLKNTPCQAQVPLPKEGSVRMELASYSRVAKINADREAYFADIPYELSGETATFELVRGEYPEPYFLTDTEVSLEPGQHIALAVELKHIDTLARQIVDVDEGKRGIPGARVRIGQLEAYSDSSGFVRLAIPCSEQRKFQVVEVSKAGYQFYSRNIPLQTQENEIPLQKELK